MSSSRVDEDTQPLISAEGIDNIYLQSTSVQRQNNRPSIARETSSVGDDASQKDKQSETVESRRRTATEKGKSEKIGRLRQRRITALCAVTRQRNALSALMTDSNNLHLVKLELSHLEERFAEYRKACEFHLKELIEGEAKQAVIEQNDSKEKDILANLPESSVVMDH